MQRYRIDVSYDGSAYSGWQIQPNGMTIQQRLQEAIASLCGEETRIHGSGRTDQGVHARQQVAHFDLERALRPVAILKGINGLLPDDIRILKADAVSPSFHARRSAIGKEYRYFIWNRDIMPPHVRLYRAHATRALDVDRMQKAASYLVGRHDFASFTANPNRFVASTVRHVFALSVRERGPEITIVAKGEGFLYKMVRSLAGFLMRVGEGVLPPSAARTIMYARKRTARVPTAPPEGLFLWHVSYPRQKYSQVVTCVRSSHAGTANGATACQALPRSGMASHAGCDVHN